MKLEVFDLSYSYSTTPVLKGISLTAEKMVTAIIGPNGAGKSTLLTCIAGLLRPEGKILLNGTDIRKMDRDDFSKALSYLPQDAPSRAVLTVFEAVLLGRLHSLKWRVGEEDLGIVYRVMGELGIEELASRTLNELSGGQRQMVSIAQALVKEPEILLMDEPTNSLDLQRQLELFELIREISADKQITLVTALHDLNLAARYADHIVVMKEGEVVSSGSPNKVLTCEMIESVYGVHARVSVDEEGIPEILPVCSAGRRKNHK
ncbi:ferrichrome ABC transporter ATP-binding protein [Methanosarcina sp. 2.H.T.1A.6]|uniref:ABC transporter ATP-binding protein n=1 Tax=unclassified Methanosarcina TaxID=2644672 RepID=UPI000621D63B|nr:MULTISPECIES: ABC transporter ATP-binding protein [unclassified Methanosarcina]KKG14868.1 ferrichrome ABC transporter ATP-binding protein [Methanosarcina sp. 2.H.T.1A.15]KKG19033.1 ferrichrome ABC transporter ATP-binding protein [Methanosarcina sp. 2.H.T.1A.3]KKG20841.1 ferrichrome ABC transporter ATP-binding protein [Methanosarcina sp. 2.H.T.1A.6]KKG22238.1 ferrichrome ABC transporter ATP-binding protein [Methanosarcina sp. 2.H.T.1A.8]